MNIAKISVWHRISVVASALWLLGNFAGFEPYRRSSQWNEFIGVGIIPLIIIWGLTWIIRGSK